MNYPAQILPHPNRFSGGALIAASLAVGALLGACQGQESRVQESANTVLQRIYAGQLSGESPRLTSAVITADVDAFGFSGSLSQRFLSPDKFEQTFDLGPMTVSQTYDGREGWTVDQNGSALRLSGYELGALVTSCYITNLTFLLDDSLAGTREYIGPMEYGGRGGQKFRFLPPGGNEIEVIIDSLTGSFLRSSTLLDDISEETVYSDFRSVDGIPLPFHIESNSSIQQTKTVIDVIECEVNVPLDPLSFTLADSPLDNIRFPSGRDSVVIPLEYNGGHLFVTVRVEGSGPRRFLLDSGAGANLLTRSFADSLGLEVSGEIPTKGATGYGTVGLVHVSSLRVGQVELVEQTVGALDLPANVTAALGAISGILGYEFFSRIAVQIDLNNGRIIAYRPDFLASRDLNGAHELPLSFSNKIPHVPGSYSGVGGEFLIDLGSNLGLIFLREYARKTGLDTLATTGGGVTIGGVGGATTAGNVIVDEFTLGDLKLQDFPAVILGEGQGIAASREVAGNLGLVFWRDYLLTLDYPGRRALIIPVN